MSDTYLPRGFVLSSQRSRVRHQGIHLTPVSIAHLKPVSDTKVFGVPVALAVFGCLAVTELGIAVSVADPGKPRDAKQP